MKTEIPATSNSFRLKKKILYSQTLSCTAGERSVSKDTFLDNISLLSHSSWQWFVFVVFFQLAGGHPKGGSEVCFKRTPSNMSTIF